MGNEAENRMGCAPAYIESETAQTVTVAGSNADYDASAKKLVAQKPILAYILKSALDEYAGVPVERIAEEFIEGMPQVSEIAVHQDHSDAAGPEGKESPKERSAPAGPEGLEDTGLLKDQKMSGSRIVGMANEDASIREGKVLFDIRFAARVPGDGSLMDVIVNVEVQRNDKPGYPITKRGIYYGSRLISAQRGTVFKDQEYEKIKKVVSIWICSGSSRERSDTINEYAIEERTKRGKYREKREDYDLMRIVVMRLGDKGEESGDAAIRLLSRLFSNERDDKNKKAVLSEEFKIAVTEEISREVSSMCNLSAGIYDKGRREGMREGMREGRREGMREGIREGERKGRLETHFELVRDGVLSAAQAGQRMGMELSLFEEEYKEYLLSAGAD